MPSVERREICTFQPYRTDRERAQWIRSCRAAGPTAAFSRRNGSRGRNLRPSTSLAWRHESRLRPPPQGRSRTDHRPLRPPCRGLQPAGADEAGRRWLLLQPDALFVRFRYSLWRQAGEARLLRQRRAACDRRLLPSAVARGRKAAPPGDPEPSGGEIVAKGIEIHINTFVGGGYHQDVEVTNRALAAATVRLDFLFAADFADIAEVSSGKRTARRRRSAAASTDRGPARPSCVFAYQHEKLNHATRDSASPRPERSPTTGRPSARRSARHRRRRSGSRSTSRRFSSASRPSPGSVSTARRWRRKEVARTTRGDGCRAHRVRACRTRRSSRPGRARRPISGRCRRWRGRATRHFTPIGGIPKYTGLFGRDSLVVGMQSTFLNRATLNGSLLSVGEWTAKEVDNGHDAEPGKVLHQRQLSPLALLGTTPFLHYYGDYSAPAYYLIGAALHFLKAATRRPSKPSATRSTATLAWMDRYGDIDGDGFYEYRTLAGKKGLKNQGWKDSGQAILYPDGSLRPRPDRGRRGPGTFLRRQTGDRRRFRRAGRSRAGEGAPRPGGGAEGRGSTSATGCRT